MSLSRALILTAVAALAATSLAQENKPLPGSKECLDCHESGRRTGRREPGMPPPFDAASLRASPHGGQECTACHMDVDPKKLPHADKLAPVDCGLCHPDEQKQY